MYYVTDKNSDLNVGANNIENPENMTDNDSDKPDILHKIVVPNTKRNERLENLEKTLLQSQCIALLKAEFLSSKISL